jgi:hypothetical protein
MTTTSPHRLPLPGSWWSTRLPSAVCAYRPDSSGTTFAASAAGCWSIAPKAVMAALWSSSNKCGRATADRRRLPRPRCRMYWPVKQPADSAERAIVDRTRVTDAGHAGHVADPACPHCWGVASQRLKLCAHWLAGPAATPPADCDRRAALQPPVGGLRAPASPPLYQVPVASCSPPMTMVSKINGSSLRQL